MAEELAKEEGKKGGKKKLFLFIVLGVLIIGIASGVAFLFLGKDKGESKESSGSKKAKKAENTVFIDMDPIIVNLLDPTGKRYLQVRLSFEVADKKSEEEFKKKEPKIKDLILTILSGKTLDEVIVPDAKERIKGEILKKLKEELGEEVVINVYITQYIVE